MSEDAGGSKSQPNAPDVVASRSLKRRIVAAAGILLALYLAAAYVLIPVVWERYAHDHPAFDDDPRITSTRDGHPGDPLNVALIGSQQQIAIGMQKAGWYPAAPLGLRSDLKIAADTVLKRPDNQAPLSNLYLFGRREDLAFEQPVGGNPRQRNHVRFWKSPRPDHNGRTIWIGAATYDEKVGFSHTTGQITHHIAADVDAERDRLFADLDNSGHLADFYTVPGFHTKTTGRNGGGDQWYTDGALYVGVLADSDRPLSDPDSRPPLRDHP